MTRRRVKKQAKKIAVEVYIDKYDVQGDSIPVPREVDDRAKWAAFKQLLLEDFVASFDVNFKKRYKMTPEQFGKGFYKDNAMNRRLQRVGRQYDKALGLKNRLKQLVMNRNFIVRNESELIDTFSRRWTSAEDEFVARGKGAGLSDKQIGQRLFRSAKGIQSRRYRMKKK